jgi:hypothetical protein
LNVGTRPCSIVDGPTPPFPMAMPLTFPLPSTLPLPLTKLLSEVVTIAIIVITTIG